MRWTLAAACLLVISGSASAQISESFAGGDGGWMIVAYPFRSHAADPATTAVPFDASFGNPAGSIRAGDVFAETGVAAPTAFLGDKHAFYGGNLRYDIFVRYADTGAIYPAVVLNAGSYSLYYDTECPPVEAWQTRTIPLTESGWRRSGSQDPVDRETFLAALGELHGIYLYTEWRTGPDDTSIDNVELAAAPIGVDDATLPAPLSLQPACPNPFNPVTTIRFELAAAGPVRVAVIDPTGAMVRQLVTGWLAAGPHATRWDGRDETGRAVASGSYVCRVEAAGTVASRTLTLLK